jgi:hypothetical protein
LLQPSSCEIGATSKPKRYWLVPYEMIVVTPSALTTVHP